MPERTFVHEEAKSLSGFKVCASNYGNNQRDAIYRLIYYSKSVSGFKVCASNYGNNQRDAIYRLIYYSKSALHVSGDIFAHHKGHLTVFTVSGSVHPSCCRPAAGRQLG